MQPKVTAVQMIAVICGTSTLLASADNARAARSAGAFLGSRGDAESARAQLEATVRSVLDASVGGLEGVSASAAAGAAENSRRRLDAIEANLRVTFEALPKATSAQGADRAAPRAVRHMVRGYFAREHGWLIKGIEPHDIQVNASDVSDAGVLQDRAPALVEAMVEAHQSKSGGLLLRDVAAMVAALETLIFQESRDLLETVFEDNGLTLSSTMDDQKLHHVLLDYLVLFRHGPEEAALTSAALGGVADTSLEEFTYDPRILDYQRDAALAYGYSSRSWVNPFRDQQFAFFDALQIVTFMMERYGKWQNDDCLVMKGHLMELNAESETPGRVRLSSFHADTDKGGDFYAFTESAQVLQEIGALEITQNKVDPDVLIANYLASSLNCIPGSSYYSICCIDECENLLHDLNGRLLSPSAPAETLLNLIGNLSSATVDAPREIPEVLKEKLRIVAERHGGEVPLHGRLFKQWMHYAFPFECGYPQAGAAARGTQPGLDDATTVGNALKYGNAAAKGDEGKAATALGLTWNDEEVLPLFEESAQSTTSGIVGACRAFGRLAAALGLLFVFWRAASSYSPFAKTPVRGKDCADNMRAHYHYC